MDSETLRNLLCLIGIVAVMVGSALSFNKITKQEEYQPLLESGQKVNLNIFTLLAAYLRRSDDPLRSQHIKIAKIGLRYFFGMIAGIILVPAAIVSLLLITGIR